MTAIPSTDPTTGSHGAVANGPASDVMRAVLQDRYGSAEVLRVGSAQRPSITDSQVLIAVEAAGIDRGTWHLLTGTPYLVRAMGFGLTRPKQPIPGLDVAGRVVAVGSGVTRFTPGDEVFGIASGSFAEYAAAEEHKLAVKPPAIAWEEAAVAAVSGITALQALETAGASDGQQVLVLGASGGVGSYAVQIATALGAEVTGVASGGKAEMVRSLGAAHVLDYAVDDFADGSAAYDVIIDTGGNSSLRRLRRALTPRGTLVIVGGETGGRWTAGIGRQLRAALLSPFVPQRLRSIISKEHFAPMEALAAMLERGEVVPAIDRVVGLDGVADAIDDLADGRVKGKVAVRVAAG